MSQIDDFVVLSEHPHFRLTNITSGYTAKRFKGEDHLEVTGINLIRRAPEVVTVPSSGEQVNKHDLIARSRRVVSETPDLPYSRDHAERSRVSKGQMYQRQQIMLSMLASRSIRNS